MQNLSTSNNSSLKFDNKSSDINYNNQFQNFSTITEKNLPSYITTEV